MLMHLLQTGIENVLLVPMTANLYILMKDSVNQCKYIDAKM